MVTIYDVAARAGVSIATVSHALNRPDRVAARTRERVLVSAQELGFTPRGRGPAPRSLRRVAVAGPLTAHPSLTERLLGMLESAGACETLVIDTAACNGAEGGPGPDEPVLGPFTLPRDLDGLILLGGVPTPELAEHLAAASVPTVLVDALDPTRPCVAVDDAAGGALVAEHLWGQGLRHPLWVSPAPPGSGAETSGERRLQGFTQRWHELAGTDATAHPLPWVLCDRGLAGGRAAARDLLDSDARPDAVFCLQDTIAAGVLQGLREAAPDRAEHIAVVGCDDTDLAAALDLTSIRQPFRATGVAAWELLAAPPEEVPPPAVFTPTLAARASTTAIRTSPQRTPAPQAPARITPEPARSIPA